MFKVGSDPEFQLVNKEGKVVSAIDLIPGTKDNPFRTKHGAVQYDNIFAEVNSIPSSSMEEFVTNHRLILDDLRDIIRPLDLELGFMASILADESLLSDPRANMAGCDPDFNAWLLSINDPADYSSTNVRASGGHIHCSFSQASDEETGESARIKFVKALDLILGVPSVIHDDDKVRRQLYGKAGSFRPKYRDLDGYDGVEYRTLSNFWLRSDSLMRFVWSGVETVYNNLDEISEKAIEFKDDIINIINSGSKEGAIALCERLEVKYEA